MICADAHPHAHHQPDLNAACSNGDLNPVGVGDDDRDCDGHAVAHTFRNAHSLAQSQPHPSDQPSNRAGLLYLYYLSEDLRPQPRTAIADRR
jgi:hypothetical protein